MNARSAALLVGIALLLVLACNSHVEHIEHVGRPPQTIAETIAPAEREASNAGAGLVAPTPAPTVAVPVRRPGAYANLDPGDDDVLGPPDPYADCEEELARAGVKFRVASLPVHVPPRSKIACGAPQVVTYLHGPGNIAYNAAPLVTCSMALALASFERILQGEALAIFGSPVARIDQLGTYNCREMAARRGWVSEHSYANAIDIGSFALKNGKTVDVLRDFDVGQAQPSKAGASFLRVVSRRATTRTCSRTSSRRSSTRTTRTTFISISRATAADGTRPRTD